MASQLIGTWSLEEGENLNDYLRQLGMALTKRKVEVTKKPQLIISQNSPDQWCITIDMKTKGTETLFKEGEEVDTCNNFLLQTFTFNLDRFLIVANELKFVFDQRFYFDARRKCRVIV